MFQHIDLVAVLPTPPAFSCVTLTSYLLSPNVILNTNTTTWLLDSEGNC